MNRKGPALFSRIRRSRSAGSCSIIKETVSCRFREDHEDLEQFGKEYQQRYC